MTTLARILSYYHRYRGIAVFTMVVSSLFEILDLIVPYALGQMLNVLSDQPLDPHLQSLLCQVQQWLAIPDTSTMRLTILLGLIFAGTVLKAPIQPWLGHWLHWHIPLQARRDHQIEAQAKLLGLPLQYYEENNPGRISGLIGRGLSNYTFSYPETVGMLVPKTIRVVAISAIIALTEWRIALAFLVSFVLILTITILKLKKIGSYQRRLERFFEDAESRTSEIISNIKTIKAFATEDLELERQRRRYDRLFKFDDYRIHLGYVQLNMVRTTIVQVCVFSILVAALVATVQHQITLGQFVTLITIAGMAYAEVAPIGVLLEGLSRRYGSLTRFQEFLQLPTGADSVELLPTDPPEPLRDPSGSVGSLEFRHVTFGYDPEHPVLKDFDLKIEPCQTIALVGRSGGGKSTLVKLLFRYFEPNQGQILLDGQDIRSLDVRQFRRQLAIVHQDVDVFNGSLLSNLTYGNPTASWDEIESACRIARVDEVIEQLPEGYQTVVGEKGIRLSGGQRQRLGIARALLTDPEILVFDEATSSLDYESERAIQLAMQGILGSRTTIIIAHRLSTVREADLIVVLDQGQIVEMGNHTQLLNQSGLYQRLHALQSDGDLLSRQLRVEQPEVWV